jgi:Beta-1,4-xylanase
MLYGSLGMAAAMTSVASRCQSSLLDGGVDFSNSLAQAAREDVSKAAPLKERAKGKGLLYGAATMWGVLESDAAFADVIKRECDILTAENELKWDTLRPSPMSFNFDWGDRLVEFNRQNNLLTRGHTLVWHWVPGWFRETVNQQNAELFLVEHITKVVSRYAGQIHSWDVVNEAIAPEEGRSDGLRQSPWLEFLGEDYIEIAFHAAAAADPSALLVYNDYGLEYDTFNDDKSVLLS